MVSPLVSKDIMKSFDYRFKNYKYNILSQIHNKYLLNHIDKEELFKEFSIPENIMIKPKLIIVTKNVEEMCNAKVYKHDGPHRCKRKKFNDNEFCKHHILRRNYGRFDD